MRLSFKTILLGIFSLLVLVAAAQGTISVFKLAAIRHGITEVATNWLPSVAANDIRAAASEVRIKQLRLLQGSTGQAVDAIDAIATRIREINGVATSIAAAVEEQGAATQEIVRNVAQVASGTSEVTTNIAGVAGAAEETGAATSQVLGEASELSCQSEHLAAEVARFLATVRAA